MNLKAGSRMTQNVRKVSSTIAISTKSNRTVEKVALVSVVVLACCVFTAHAQQLFRPWEPPWQDFDDSVVVRTYYGDVRGFSVPWHMEDEAWRPDWEDQPRWFVQRVNCFLGVPYAQPPLGRLRFQRPRRPKWGGTWEAKWFRNSCPQDVAHIREDIPTYPRSNVSEDCLYMNVFAPNITWHSLDTLYPVVVFIHGGQFTYGTSQIYPGQVLVKQEIVVVTFNYRLGALGFLTTDDEHGAGNWGLWDTQLALEFVRENIKAFRGDPNQITLMGDEAGAATAGHMIISPYTSNKRYFHKAILMSGSDMAGLGYINPFWRPRDYGKKLAELLECPTDDSFVMLECLRDNKTRPWEKIVQAQAQVKPHDGKLGDIWGPVQDGGMVTEAILPYLPPDLRRQMKWAKIPIIIGINQQDGTRKANSAVQGLGNGMFQATFDDFLKDQLRSWRVMDRHWQRALEAVRFQYTYWPDPGNRTARAQEFIGMVTDLDFGIGMDRVIKYHAPHESSYMYVWSYKSYDDFRPHWMGSSYSGQIPYVFGYPFMNETVLNQTELQMRQWYNWEDRNMSDCTMMMWTNFIKYTIPTPNVTCNVTWDPYTENNLTYLILDFHKHMWFRYNQAKYGFWQSYFPTLAKQDYLTPTATPTPAGYEFVYATGSMSAVLALALLAVGIFIYLLWQQSREEEIRQDLYDQDLPRSFTTPRPMGSQVPSGVKEDYTDGVEPYYNVAGAIGGGVKRPYAYPVQSGATGSYTDQYGVTNVMDVQSRSSSMSSASSLRKDIALEFMPIPRQHIPYGQQYRTQQNFSEV